MNIAPNTSKPASQPAQGGQPAPSGAAAAGNPSKPSAAPSGDPFGTKKVSLADLGYPAPKAKPQAASATPPEGGHPAQPAENAQPPGGSRARDGRRHPARSRKTRRRRRAAYGR